jgi:hypothetical protein
MAVGVTITTNGTLIQLVKIKVVKGNELTDIVMETFDGGDMPASTWEAPVNAVTAAGTTTVHVERLGLYDKVNAQRMSHQLAVLGARGDYFELIASGLAKGTTTSATDLRNFAVEMLDYSGVPVAVQHAIFGKYSPFVTPTQPVGEGMIKGIDRQKIMAAYNVVAAADDTYLSQLVRGSTDSRIQHKMNDYTGASAEAAITHTLKCKPNADGVFVLPMNGIIWAGYGPAATRAYVDASS